MKIKYPNENAECSKRKLEKNTKVISVSREQKTIRHQVVQIGFERTAIGSKVFNYVNGFLFFIDMLILLHLLNPWDYKPMSSR